MMPRQPPKNRPRFTPETTTVIAYDSERGVHIFITDHNGDKIRATCAGGCDPGQWRSGVDAYEDIKADFDKQHGGAS